MKINDTDIEVVNGSVVSQQVDAIVNAANEQMRGGGGVDDVIHRAAGHKLLEELMQKAPHGAKTGEAVVTKAYELRQKYVIHVAGPRWNGGHHGEAGQLVESYYHCLEADDGLELPSVGFCSISTGIFHFPLDIAAPFAIETTKRFIREHPATHLRRIVFAMWGPDEYAAFRKAYADAALTTS